MSVIRKAEEGRSDWMMVRESGTISDSITHCVPESQCAKGSVASSLVVRLSAFDSPPGSSMGKSVLQ